MICIGNIALKGEKNHRGYIFSFCILCIVIGYVWRISTGIGGMSIRVCKGGCGVRIVVVYIT